MITLITLIPFAAFVLALFLRGKRIRRLRTKVGRLEGLVADLRHQLARGDQVADRLRGALWLTRLQMAGERRLLRAAEKEIAAAQRDALEWKGIACYQMERLVSVQERQQLDAAVASVEDGLREIEA